MTERDREKAKTNRHIALSVAALALASRIGFIRGDPRNPR
jgi:hypothetical protein